MVKTIQKKLKSLGYYSGSIDGDYGSGTKKAVIAFQKANGLKQTGNVNSATLEKLNSGGSSSSSKSSSSSSSSSASAGDPCSPGDKGAAVKAVQKKLKSLGYYTGSVDGDYGNGTKTAVKAFQKANGLTVNGVANSKTISKMNSSSAKKASSGGGGSSNYTTESLNWFKHPNTIPHHANFQVKDVKTGKVFNVKRWTGANHADCEPATKSDTAIMKSIYGHWSWKRRAILVKYNGHVYAASMNGMPHGTQTIKNNNFDGHFCIHFTGSKTHGSKKVDSAHQNCIKTALKYTW
ncbi:MAG: peptidoglycan-binding protein [Clostridia bacterium]|nr:peptidoglycan-binding protein [Clostridia bacterium]